MTSELCFYNEKTNVNILRTHKWKEHKQFHQRICRRLRKKLSSSVFVSVCINYDLKSRRSIFKIGLFRSSGNNVDSNSSGAMIRNHIVHSAFVCVRERVFCCSFCAYSRVPWMGWDYKYPVPFNLSFVRRYAIIMSFASHSFFRTNVYAIISPKTLNFSKSFFFFSYFSYVFHS